MERQLNYAIKDDNDQLFPTDRLLGRSLINSFVYNSCPCGFWRGSVFLLIDADLEPEGL